MTLRSVALLALAAGAMAGLGAAGGCGGRSDVQVDSLANLAVGELVRVEGTLALRGSQPFPALLLETDEGGLVRIESKTIQGELERLATMRVAIEGDAMPPVEKMPVINALRYEMMRLPSGELPVVGVVSMAGDRCILTTRDGSTYWMRGTLVGVIREYDGARVWVVGSFGDEALGDDARGAMSYWVSGYGVLSEPY